MVSERKYVVTQIIHRAPNITEAHIRRNSGCSNLLKFPHKRKRLFDISDQEFASKTFQNQLEDGEYMVVPLVGKKKEKSVRWFSKRGYITIEYDNYDHLINTYQKVTTLK